MLFLPNLVWNIQHRFPFFEMLANIRNSGRNVPLTHLQFLGQLGLHMNPVAVLIVLAGLYFFFGHPQGKQFRVLGWASLVLLAVIMFSANGRPYYVAPAYPMLFGAGAVAMEGWLSRRRLRWLRPVYVSLLLIAGAVGAPMAVPVLSAENYLRYTQWLRFSPPPIETDRLGPLPQFYADMFGWEEMAAEVGRVYNSLPPDIRPKTAILASTFSQAGAIDLFGPKFGLPNSIGLNQSYFLWGPRDYTGESVLVLGLSREQLEGYFNSVETVGNVSHPYSMPYEHCRQPKISLAQVWPKLKKWS